MKNFIKDVLDNLPNDWLGLTTHRLDVYNEELAKIEFLEQFDLLFKKYIPTKTPLHAKLKNLPTAYDYIRLGHPLSCVLEWVIANLNGLHSKNVISFSSRVAPILAILRKNLLDNKNTQINYTGKLPAYFNIDILREVYGYQFILKKVEGAHQVSAFDGSTVFLSSNNGVSKVNLLTHIDFHVNIHSNLGSFVLVNGTQNDDYIKDIQHFRRRETIAMTPANCLSVLTAFLDQSTIRNDSNLEGKKANVVELIKEITDTTAKPLVGSSGLSIQYAIMVGLIDDALKNQKDKNIKFIVPSNCYGGTNDQARRVAACFKNVEIVDVLVDGAHNMVHSLDAVLDKIAKEDAIPYIIAEIPTNPRVEVPNLLDLKAILSKNRKTLSGQQAIAPVFILDQTFCPNVHFLGEGEILSTIKSISYASGSKFPSGGLCTAGYCVANDKAEALLDKIELHLKLCDNEATALQYKVLANQMPSMNQRIYDAYTNTREFVDFIKVTLPEAKINFVSEELALKGFTPSVFSLDLPTKGNSTDDKESYKRKLNDHLIQLMITKIPNESKHCVSYGQLNGCYWTIPATSTQGTTKEGDKDYIVRVSLSPNMDVELHKKVFLDFVKML